jgi:predicted metal-dependent phosphoesterase TrpH
MKTKYADLHMHTTVSDGTDDIIFRADDARDKGLSCIAITDHDATHHELDERVQTIKGVEVISGAEIKAGLNGRKIEILGYFLDRSDERLQQMLERIEQFRVERMEKMIRKVNQLIDSHISFNEVAVKADASIGRPHLAATLVEKGEVETVSDAFEEYIGDDKPGYVESEKMPAAKVIEAIHDNGGICSLAHPGRSLPKENAIELVRQLQEKGLDAIEVPYTYDKLSNFRHSFGSDHAARIADELDLLITGGSDCHGSKSDKYYIGEIKLPYRHVEALKRRTGADLD